MKTENPSLLDIQHLNISFFTTYGEVKAVKDFSFTLNKGESAGIIGESGSGKSTLAGAIMGLIDYPGRIVSGSVYYNGNDLTRIPQRELRLVRGKKISMVFQDPANSLNPVLTIGDQLRESVRQGMGLTGNAQKEMAESLCKMVGINDGKHRMRQVPFAFSGGMLQRIMIAMALAGRPEILIADEPTSALDSLVQAQIIDLLQILRSQMNLSIILISHDIGLVASFAQRVIVMYAGRNIESAPSKEIFQKPRHPYTQALLRSIPGRRARLMPIEGLPPDMLNIPEGCPFAQRCRYCMRICLQQMPPNIPAGEGHQAACWLMDERARNVSRHVDFAEYSFD